MTSTIYFKKENQIHEVLSKHLRSIFDFFPSGFVGAEISASSQMMSYFYWSMEDGTLCRTPIRKHQDAHGNNVYSCLPMFVTWNISQKRFNLAANSIRQNNRVSLRTLSSNEFFSVEEQTLCIERHRVPVAPERPESPTPLLTSSPLSEEQQYALYHGNMNGAIFCEAVEEILELENGEQILMASISIQHTPLSDNDTIEVRTFRYQFLAPNVINDFPQSLCDEKIGGPITIGAVHDYYTFCIQSTLQNKVSSAHLIKLGEANRSKVLGAKENTSKYGNDGIYNRQGLYGTHELIYRTLRLIIQLQKTVNFNTEMASIFTPLSSRDCQLLRIAVQDLINAIKFERTTQRPEYIEIYMYIEAEFPREGWINLLYHLEHAFAILLQRVSAISDDEKQQNNKGTAICAILDITTNPKKQHLVSQLTHELTGQDIWMGALLYDIAPELATTVNMILVRHLVPFQVMDIINALQRVHLFTPANLLMLLVHKDLANVTKALRLLQGLTQPRFDILFNRESFPFQLVTTLNILLKLEVELTVEILDFLFSTDPLGQINKIITLHLVDIPLSKQNLKLAANKSPAHFLLEFAARNKVPLPPQSHRNVAALVCRVIWCVTFTKEQIVALKCSMINKKLFGKILVRLAYEGIRLTSEQLNKVIAHQDFDGILAAFDTLINSNRLLTRVELDALCSHDRPVAFIKIIIELYQQTILLTDQELLTVCNDISSEELKPGFSQNRAFSKQLFLKDISKRIIISPIVEQSIQTSNRDERSSDIAEDSDSVASQSEENEFQRLDTVELPEVHFTAKQYHAYEKLWLRSKADQHIPLALQNAYCLLDDYTKGDVQINSAITFFKSCGARLSRHISGHWNRHHTHQIALILSDIRNSTITTMEQLIIRLETVTNLVNFNPEGSLARRIAFIQNMQQTIGQPREMHAILRP